MTFDQSGIHLGTLLYIRYYFLILVGGALAGGYLASLEARRRRTNPDLVWDGILWVLVCGIIGARVWHILTPPPSMVAAGFTTQWYLTHPLVVTNGSIVGALVLGNGGLGLPGAVAGIVVGLYFFTRRARLRFAVWVDIAAPALALGQAIGRWGSYVNQESYGTPTTLPWAIDIAAQNRLPGYTDPALRFHPTFLYESIGNLLICLALLYIARRFSDSLKAGDLFILYLIFYPVLRFGLEFLRLDSSEITASALNLTLNANQTLMAILAVVAAFWYASRHRTVRRHQLKTQAPAGS